MSGVSERPWIEWAGGKCPVDANVPVFVRYRDGVETTLSNLADVHIWLHVKIPGKRQLSNCDIVAYREAGND